MEKGLVYCCLLLLAGSVGSCSEPEKTLLAGRYYTSCTEDGDPGLYFDDPQLGTTELEYASVVGVAKAYVAYCGDSCYLFSTSAITVEAARRSRIGPLTDVAACEQKVFQLTGDSLVIRSLINGF
jgi:hypothetical protein